MAKAQQNPATNAGISLAGEQAGAPTPMDVVSPSIKTATGQQNQQIANSADTLNTQKSQIAPAQSTYENFAKTGGFSPTDETTYLNRATQGVSGTYDVLGQAAERQRAAAGGLGTGGEFSQMARQGTQAQAMATENAQANLKMQENQNKLAGASGLNSLANTENQLYNTQTGQITDQGKQILQSLGLAYNTEAEGAKILASLAGAPSQLMQQVQQVQGVAGPAAGLLQGIAGAF